MEGQIKWGKYLNILINLEAAEGRLWDYNRLPVVDFDTLEHICLCIKITFLKPEI